MTRRHSIQVKDSLQRLFSSRRLRRLAKETGAVKRERKVDIVAYFWAFVLSFGNATTRSIAAARQSYIRETGVDIEESSFHDRLNVGFVGMLERVLEGGLEQVSLGAGEKVSGILRRFKDILITDGSLIRLHDALAADFPNARTNHSKAALKAHVVMSVMGCGSQSIRVTNGRQHDGPVLTIGPWVKKKLFLFDLGYYANKLFAKIEESGGFFVTRLKINANPKVVAVDSRMPSHLREFTVGKGWQDLIAVAYASGIKVIDARVRMSDGCGYRTVAIRNDEQAHRYHTYITNLPVDVVTADGVQALYALRWLIEMLFKEWKTHYRLGDIKCKKPVVVKAMLYVNLITML